MKKKSVVPDKVQVTVDVRPGWTVQVVPAHTPKDERPNAFLTWVEKCKQIKEDEWPVSPKLKADKEKLAKHNAALRRLGEKPLPPLTIKIADMHVMQLVNSIKWCIRMADTELRRSWYANFGKSRASLLAPVPQWQSLIEEGRKRQLKMIVDCADPATCLQSHAIEECAQWYQESCKAIAMLLLTD